MNYSYKIEVLKHIKHVLYFLYKSMNCHKTIKHMIDQNAINSTLKEKIFDWIKINEKQVRIYIQLSWSYHTCMTCAISWDPFINIYVIFANLNYTHR